MSAGENTQLGKCPGKGAARRGRIVVSVFAVMLVGLVGWVSGAGTTPASLSSASSADRTGCPSPSASAASWPTSAAGRHHGSSPVSRSWVLS